MSVPQAVSIILVLILLEGFFSGSELALVSADRVAIRARRERGGRSARLLARFLEEPERILTTTLIGTNLCVVSATTVFGLMLAGLLGSAGEPGGHTELWTVVVLSPLLLLFGELIPKSVYRRYSRSLAPVVIHPLTWLSWALFPLVALVRWLSRGLMRAAGQRNSPAMAISRDELRLLMEHGAGGEIEQEERRMIRRIFDFPQVTAKEVMVPLIDVVAVEESSSLSDAARLFSESGHTRLPIFHERVDDIVGVLHSMDLLHADARTGIAGQLRRPVTYVPPTQKVETLFTELQRQRHGIAIVVDEWGGAEGMITVEDILEEILGEIEDEHDDPSLEIRQRGEREFLVSARVEVDHLNEELDVAIPAGAYETVAGFLLERFGRIPRPGDSASTEKALFTVVRASERVIEEVQVLLHEQGEPGDSGGEPR